MTGQAIVLVSQLTPKGRKPIWSRGKCGSTSDMSKYDAELYLKWLEEDGQGGKRQVVENEPFSVQLLQ